MPNATVGTPYVNAQINFTITAGGTAFAAGDTFALTNSRTTGNFIICVKGASDGSNTPAAVLADSVDASVSPQMVGAYFMGEFNALAVTIDPSWTLADISVALQPRGIHLKGPVSAADPVPAT
jgi:Bacteriophage lambda head decoration protein D